MISPITLLYALVIAMSWGASFVFMRASAPEFTAVPLIFVRVTVGGLVLLPLMFLHNGFGIWKKDWLKIACVGTMTAAIPFTLLTYALYDVSAGMGSVLNATTPLMAALWAIPLLGEKLTLTRIMGLGLGLLGVIALAVGQNKGFELKNMLPIVLGLSATCCYGWSTHMSKIWLPHIPPTIMTCAGMLSGTVLLAPLAFWLWPDHSISTKAWGMAIALGVVCSALAFYLFYKLIGLWGATRAVTVVYLIPVFGMLWSYLFLEEPVTWSMVFGCCLILGGVILLTFYGQPKKSTQ